MNRECPGCEGEMGDQGRVVDLLDEYSPYLDQNWTDLVDGDPDSSLNGKCLHLFVCQDCKLAMIIKE
ncbi:hypothetical protein MUN89_16670 [Halobacillus salinarum]|uniref:Uncharacterized protein n=1 Tax=Halobacillus salinarum TaxID=2932257 RepID=A0ABY4EJ35_9BACI|nr:hypothetical protein [Halobacillus salinarum]UOQ43532.1 hypothetical protein MUN89_16670 [Halobacillus salinarum]